MWTAGLRRWVNPELFYEFALLGEHLDSLAAALANVDETILRGVGAVKRGREHLLIWRRPRCVVRRRGVVVDFAEGRAFASQAAFERASIHVVDQDALVQETVRNVKLAGVFVE